MPKLDKRSTQIYTVPETYGSARESPLPSKKDSSKASIKIRRDRLHDDEPLDRRTDRTGLQLPRTNDTSPWTDYKKSYELRLGIGIRVVVAVQNNFPYDEVTVREFSDTGLEDRLRVLECRHTNIVSILEIFRFEEKTYVMLEHMPLSLHHLGQSRLPLKDIQLAAIFEQILRGLLHLCTSGLGPKSLSSSNILAHPTGIIKIAGHEHFTPLSSTTDKPQNFLWLSEIAMELMQGYVKEDGNVGVDDPGRWSSDTLNFLSGTTCIDSVEELMKQPLLQLPWTKETLKEPISFAMLSVHRGYKYPLN